MGEQKIEVTYYDKGDKRYIEMPEIIDVYSHIEVKDITIKILKGTDNDIVLDMKKMKRIESSGISVIVMIQKLIEDDNRKLFFTNISKLVKEVMECIKMSFREL